MTIHSLTPRCELDATSSSAGCCRLTGISQKTSSRCAFTYQEYKWMHFFTYYLTCTDYFRWKGSQPQLLNNWNVNVRAEIVPNFYKAEQINKDLHSGKGWLFLSNVSTPALSLKGTVPARKWHFCVEPTAVHIRLFTAREQPSPNLSSNAKGSNM